MKRPPAVLEVFIVFSIKLQPKTDVCCFILKGSTRCWFIFCKRFFIVLLLYFLLLSFLRFSHFLLSRKAADSHYVFQQLKWHQRRLCCDCFCDVMVVVFLLSLLLNEWSSEQPLCVCGISKLIGPCVRGWTDCLQSQSKSKYYLDFTKSILMLKLYQT